MIHIRLLGISFGASVGFFALISFMLYIDQTGVFLQTLEATLIHELGHFGAMCLLGSCPKAVECRIGAVVLRGRLGVSPKREAFICFAGPLINITVFQIMFLIYYFWGFGWCLSRALVNLVMGIFHLLPIEGLDGGTVIFWILSGRCNQKTTNLVCRVVTFVFLLGLLVCSIFVFLENRKNPSLILLVIYLIFLNVVKKKEKQSLQSC